MNRRMAIRAALFGGTATALAPVTATAAEPQQVSERSIEDIARSIDELRKELGRPASFGDIAPVREQIKTFLRSSGKFPDYIDVGIEMWHQIYDWHVRFHQPLTVGRDPQGRYTIMLIATAVVMRTDILPGSILLPYDAK
jgi:hypothetical protein